MAAQLQACQAQASASQEEIAVLLHGERRRQKQEEEADVQAAGSLRQTEADLQLAAAPPAAAPAAAAATEDAGVVAVEEGLVQTESSGQTEGASSSGQTEGAESSRQTEGGESSRRTEGREDLQSAVVESRLDKDGVVVEACALEESADAEEDAMAVVMEACALEAYEDAMAAVIQRCMKMRAWRKRAAKRINENAVTLLSSIGDDDGSMIAVEERSASSGGAAKRVKLDGLKVSELKKLLVEGGFDGKGKKAALIERAKHHNLGQ